jgi:hypothetical protein
MALDAEAQGSEKSLKTRFLHTIHGELLKEQETPRDPAAAALAAPHLRACRSLRRRDGAPEG